MPAPRARRGRRALAVMASIVVLTAGCSSGGSDDVTTDGPTTSATNPTDAPSTTEADPGEGAASTTEASVADSSSTSSSPDPTTTTTQAQPPLPTECLGLDTPLLATQLTYLVDGKLIALDLLREPTCLLELGEEDAGAEIVAWGPQADRIMWSTGRTDVLGGRGRVGGEAGPDNLAWSWPTGFNMVWLEDGIVTKSTSDARQRRQLDLVGPVREVRYHPDGQHLFLITDDGGPGSQILVSNSEIEWASVLVHAPDAQISNLAVSAQGGTIVFQAEHDDGAIHVHELDMAAAVEVIPLRDEEVERHLAPSDEVFVKTVFEAAQPVGEIVFDANGEQIAFSEGDCRSGASIQLIDLVAGGYPLPIDPSLSASPVGFISDTQLAILVHDDDCVGGDLYVADTITGATELIRLDVDDAAIRRSEPTTQFTLIDVIITGFA